MKQLIVMIKPASSLCNLRCKYCFYADLAQMREKASFGIMQQDTVKRMLEVIHGDLDAGDRITFAFQGGEPTLAGLDYFRQFVGLVSEWEKEIHVEYALQTNATLLNDEWCRFLAEHHFLAGISLDLLPDCHNAVRVDAGGNGTYKQVRQAITLLEQYHVDYNVLCTLTNQIARYPQQVWKQICKLDLRYVQFTPCLDELGKPGQSVYALTPKRFASFYITLFSLWLADFRKGAYRSIKLFDDLVNLIAFQMPTACGINGYCQPQVVVEADGSVYPCDFYCLDSYLLGNITQEKLSELHSSSKRYDFQNRPHQRPTLCSSCPYMQLCGGNCKRMQREICCAPEDSYCGYQEFLSVCYRELRLIAQNERRERWNQSGQGPLKHTTV